jgi:ethanolamine-phosphate cytidylyltransferase
MAPNIDPEVGCTIPEPGDWPVDPQTDVAIDEQRLWIDGCFDFFHHGHAGVMLQARRLGSALFVGLHSDEEITQNKGPTVMNLAERAAAVNACRFSTLCVPHAPYVTSLPWISHYGCKYVVHGDDITSDADGNDCYRFVKKAGRMKIVKRTPGISTTDLVGRMLLCTKTHFIRSLSDVIAGKEGKGSEEERIAYGKEVQTRIKEYAAAPDGREPFVQVWSFHPKHRSIERRRSSTKGSNPAEASSSSSLRHHDGGKGSFSSMVDGHGPRAGQRIVYVDGGFDLFSSGHIAFLETVAEIEAKLGHERDWFSPTVTAKRIEETGSDYGPAYIIAGVHDDEVINHYKRINYPIMNIFERGLCVVQCKYVHSVVFSAPFAPTKSYLTNLPAVSAANKSHPDAVYHGPTSFMPASFDAYADAKSLSIFTETPAHDFQDVNAAHVVKRILDNRAQYEERQRKKGVKGVGEEATLKREKMEREAADVLRKRKEDARKELQRRHSEVERQFGM